jgi:hypothetical protein
MKYEGECKREKGQIDGIGLQRDENLIMLKIL